MAAHSRSKNGVASLAYVPAIHVFDVRRDLRRRCAGTAPLIARRPSSAFRPSAATTQAETEAGTRRAVISLSWAGRRTRVPEVVACRCRKGGRACPPRNGATKRFGPMASRASLVRASLVFALWALGAPPSLGDGRLAFRFTPAKPAGDGPFPAVVILHDCSGLGPRSSGAPRRWAADLFRQGYVTIRPDSFTPRGRPEGVCAGRSEQRITFEDRRDDAYQALAYLQSLSFVDPRRISVMGGSHGGSSTLATIAESKGNAQRPGSGFAAAVALYPACGRSFGDWSVERTDAPGHPIAGYSGVFKPLAPLLILIGEQDDWTPADACRRLAEAARSAGFPVDIKTYPGAYHAFDSPAPKTYVPDRINFNAPTDRGATTGGNTEAWADAVHRVHAFLAQHLSREAKPSRTSLPGEP